MFKAIFAYLFIICISKMLHLCSISLNVNSNNATIEVLIGSNYKRWKQDIEFALSIVDIYLALRIDEPPKSTDKSTAEEKELYAK